MNNDEPYIEDNSTIKIQGIDDIYMETYNSGNNILNTIISNYEEFQIDDKVSDLLEGKISNDTIQAIETQITQLKNNYKAIISNSSLSYTEYDELTSAGQFLFLVISGTENDKFNIIYKNDINEIIKKEFDCIIPSDGLYISIPFFFKTFNNSETTIKFEIEGNSSDLNYYIFK
jgi:hypothetical protein